MPEPIGRILPGVMELQERVRGWRDLAPPASVDINQAPSQSSQAQIAAPPDKNGEPDWKREPDWDLLNFTPIPDRLFDRYLAYLSGSELKVLMYLMRHTYGWKKREDAISLNQMLKGITRRDGSRQDHGVGLSRSALASALAGLEAKRRIERRRQHAPDGGNEPTLYVLRMAPDPSSKSNPP